MGYPRYRRSGQHKFVRPGGTSTSVNTGNAWANLSTYIAGFADLSLKECQVGDVIVADLAWMWGNEAANGYSDIATIVGGSPVTYFSSGTGVQVPVGFRQAQGLTGSYIHVTVTPRITLAAGDLVNGVATFRIRVLTSSARTLFHDASVFAVENIGPAQEA